jgi:hypothetical protein
VTDGLSVIFKVVATSSIVFIWVHTEAFTSTSCSSGVCKAIVIAFIIGIIKIVSIVVCAGFARAIISVVIVAEFFTDSASTVVPVKIHVVLEVAV